MGLKASAEKEVCWPQGERVLWAQPLLLFCHSAQISPFTSFLGHITICNCVIFIFASYLVSSTSI